MLHYDSAARASRALLGILICAALGLLWLTLPVNAEEGQTQVRAVICSGSVSSAGLQINAPQDNAIVSLVPVKVTGTVQNVSQIEVRVDAAYHSTIPIGSGQQTFETTIMISAGTHTIVLTGIDICSISHPQATLVVTYSPPVQPGPTLPTTPSSSPAPAPVSSRAPSDGANGIVTPDDLLFAGVPIIGDIVRFGHGIAVALDFDARSQCRWSVSWLRFVLLGLAGLLIIWAPWLETQWWRLRYQHSESSINPERHRQRLRTIRLLRLIGVILIPLVLVATGSFCA